MRGQNTCESGQQYDPSHSIAAHALLSAIGIRETRCPVRRPAAQVLLAGSASGDARDVLTLSCAWQRQRAERTQANVPQMARWERDGPSEHRASPHHARQRSLDTGRSACGPEGTRQYEPGLTR